MRVLLAGKNSKSIEGIVKEAGFEMVNTNPEIIISYGGDGTLLYSERMYPGVPKLPIRDSLVCIKCPDHDEKFLLKKLLEGKLHLKQYRKLKTTVLSRSDKLALYQTLYALNDFVIRNITPIHAIRFEILPSNKKLLIGDGIVVSTPFGSTGYFKSITGQIFEKGFGLAFNNTTSQLAPLFFKEKDTVTFKLVRGEATLSFDNNPDIFNVDEGSELVFKLSDKTAKIYELQSLRCPDCKMTRG